MIFETGWFAFGLIQLLYHRQEPEELLAPDQNEDEWSYGQVLPHFSILLNVV
jgi:hypothetical protein